MSEVFPIPAMPILTVPGSGATGSAGPNQQWTIVDTSVNVNAATSQFIRVDTTAGPVTATLPPATASKGFSIVVKKVSSDANAVTVAVSGGDTIDGQPFWSLGLQYGGVVVTADTGTWSTS